MRRALGWCIALFSLFLLGGMFLKWSTHESADRTASISVADILGDDEAGFERATVSRPLVFPDDHGPHPRFRSEWWYFTGNLHSETDQKFGFQLTFFRFGLTPEMDKRPSAWATNQAYMAHFALTDVSAGTFSSSERFSRGALELAGATARPFRVWLEDWFAQAQGDGFEPLRLHASEGDAGIDLELGSGKPIVLQGDEGLSRKSAQPGNASYYYSLTRMPVEGSIRIGGTRLLVEGLAWMDREWSTSALAPEQVGWDWFALQLSDGHELMYYQLRQSDGDAHPFSAGKFVDVDGTTRNITRDDISLQILDYWESPLDGAKYPSAWRLQVPGEELDVEIIPHLAAQELNLSVRYWEGAVQVRGTRGGQAVEGDGYVELTGYAESVAPATR